MKDPNFDVAFTAGSFTIYWYAILMALGIGAALVFTDRRSKGRDVPKDIALDLCILGLPCGVLGARIFACLSGQVPWSMFFQLSRSGLSFFGGIVFAAAAIVVYLKYKKVSVEEMADLAAPGIFTGLGIAVWGDFFNRNHYGPLVEKATHKWFPLATFGSDLKIHYAAFFYEFLLCAALVVLYYTVLCKKVEKKSERLVLMTLIFCLVRFAIDSIRQDLVMAGPIAFDQLCEIVIVVLCLLWLYLKRQPKAAGEARDKKPAEAKKNGSKQDEETEDEADTSDEDKDASKEESADEPDEAEDAEKDEEDDEEDDGEDDEEDESSEKPEDEPFTGLN